MTYRKGCRELAYMVIPYIKKQARVYGLDPVSVARKAGQILEDAEAPYQDKPQHPKTQQEDVNKYKHELAREGIGVVVEHEAN